MNSEIIDLIKEIVDEIRTPLLEIGLSANQIAYRKSKLEEANPKELKKAWEWLIGFKGSYLMQYQRVISLVPKHVWDHYRTMGANGTYEQEQLLIAKKLLKDNWLKRPSLLVKKSKKLEKSRKIK